jgi:hypothetical protein
MPHVTTHYRVIVAAGHHRQPRNSQKWLEPYLPSNVEAVAGTPMNPFAPPQLSYTADGATLVANFLFWSAGDGSNGQTTTDQQLNTTVGDAPLTLVAWYLPPGGVGNGQPGYLIDAFSDALNDFVDDDFVEVSPDAALTHDANVVGWVPTGNAETLKAVPGSIHTGETFEHWIGGHPSDEVDALNQKESGYAIATYHNQHVPVPKPGISAAAAWLILFGIINDAPGLQIPLGGGGPVPVGPWGPYLQRVARAAGVASLGGGMRGSAEIAKLALAEVEGATKELGAALNRVARR